MAVTEQEKGMIEDLRVKGYSSAQIGGVIKELRRRDKTALAQAECGFFCDLFPYSTSIDLIRLTLIFLT